MDTSTFDQAIQHRRQAIDSLRNEMETVCQEFIQATTQFAVEWSRSCIERTVLDDFPERTVEQGAQLVTSIQGALEQLMERMPSIVEAHVNRDEYWAHRMPAPEGPGQKTYSYATIGQSPPDHLDHLAEPVRRLFGGAGAILVKYGFVDLESRAVNRSWERQLDTEEPRYTRGYKWSQNMLTLIQRYAELYDEFTRLVRDLRNLEHQKASAQAKEMWDQTRPS